MIQLIQKQHCLWEKQQVFKFQIKEHFSQNDLDDKMVLSSFTLTAKSLDDPAEKKQHSCLWENEQAFKFQTKEGTE